MSGSVFPAPSPEQARALTDAVAGHLGIEVTLEAFEQVAPNRLVEAQIAATAAPEGSLGRGLPFFPAADGDLVPVSPMKAVASGAGATLPLLIGTTGEEMTALARSGPMDDEAAAQALARLGLDDAGVAAYRAEATSPAEAVGQALTDRTFRGPAVRVAEARIGGPAPTFHYEFEWRTPALGGLGSVHCLDLPFVFDVLQDDHVSVVAGDGAPQELADTMHRAWVSFITDLDPGWAAYDAVTRSTMVFDEVSKVVDNLLEPVRSRWP